MSLAAVVATRGTRGSAMAYDRERALHDPLYGQLEEYRDLLGTGRHSDPRSIGELVVGGDREPTPAEPVEMHSIDGVRYRPEDVPEG